MLCYVCYAMLGCVAKYSIAYGKTIIEVPDKKPRNVTYIRTYATLGTRASKKGYEQPNCSKFGAHFPSKRDNRDRMHQITLHHKEICKIFNFCSCFRDI